MAKSPLILAALAKAACPQLNFHEVKRLSAESSGAFDSALLTATTGEHFVVRMAANPVAGAELDVELRALKALTPADRMNLPFKISNLIGEAKDDHGNRALVFEFVYGSPTDIVSVSAGSELAASIADSIAAIHNLDSSLVENAHLASFEPAEVVRTRVAEVDRIAATGKVSPILLSRWEAALEDVSLFRFKPTVIHGGLSSETVLNSDNQITGILSWGSLRISDPAEDFAWIIGSRNDELADSILHNYNKLHAGADTSLRTRATLYSELDFGRWLLHGISKNDQEIIDDAVSWLEVLAEEVSTGAVGRLTAAPIPNQISTATQPIVQIENELF